MLFYLRNQGYSQNKNCPFIFLFYFLLDASLIIIIEPNQNIFESVSLTLNNSSNKILCCATYHLLEEKEIQDQTMVKCHFLENYNWAELYINIIYKDL